MHQAGFDERVGLFDVDRAPFGAGEARGESDGVAIIVDASAHAVNPAITQSNIERLRIGDARCAGVLLVKSDEELAFGAVVLSEPFLEIDCRVEEFHFSSTPGGRLTGTAPDTRWIVWMGHYGQG